MTLRISSAAGLTAILILGACNGADDDASSCFPVPETGATVAGQVGAAARALRSGSARPIHEHQGRELQGVDYQGSTLQGSSIQGSSYQGTSYQGSGVQGTQYQGSGVQGTQYQGSGVQGSEWQGREHQGIETQGTGAQGKGINGKGPNSREWRRRAFQLRDLNGVRLELAKTRAALGLTDGALVADGFQSTNAMRNELLIGTTADGSQFPVEIAGVERVENTDRVHLLVDGAPVCAPGDEGAFVEGAWNERGEHVATEGALTYSCMSGVIAKCVNWGYAPWDVGDELHQTCTRMARADYCGDGNSWTMNGTLVDIYDAMGIQESAEDPALSFEAAWGPSGAVCVNDSRYVITNANGDRVQPACFSSLPKCGSLADAQAHGAVLVNGSAHAAIGTCE